MGRKLLNSELGRLSPEEFKSAPKIPVVVVLDNVRSQFNIGSTFRSADAFAVQGIYLCGICATPPSAEIHKTALGAELTVPWKHFNSTVEAVQELKNEGFTVISIEQAEGSVSLSELRRPGVGRLSGTASSMVASSQSTDNQQFALVFGNEVMGVAQEVVDRSDAVIEIPQYGTKHSLNVSVSVGVVLWEFARVLFRPKPF